MFHESLSPVAMKMLLFTLFPKVSLRTVRWIISTDTHPVNGKYIPPCVTAGETWRLRIWIVCSSSYLVEMCVLSSGESEAVLLRLEGQEAGQQPFGDLQVVAVESSGCLGDVTELVGKFLLHDGVKLRLITLQRIELEIHQTNVKNWCPFYM